MNPLNINEFDVVSLYDPAPAAGATYTFTCPINARIQLVAFSATVTTSGVAGNRIMALEQNDTTAVWCIGQGSVQQGPTLTLVHSFTLTGDRGVISTAYTHVLSALADQTYLRPGDSVTFRITTPQAGDAIVDVSIKWKQWIMPDA